MLTIEEMQDAIRKAGWQWEEHVYNDGLPNDCSVMFTKSKNPLYFIEHPMGDIGWGRFQRRYAWLQAYEVIIVERKYG